MSRPAEQPDVTVYWRPGCGFCHLLRRQLDRAGVVRTEVNIWEDPAAAALVRSVARGNETVPTVVIGDRALVNPSAREVLAALGTTDFLRSPDRSSNDPKVLAGAGWSLAAAIGWLLLALTHPSTTYHLAPFLAALAWPLAASRAAERSPRIRRRLLTVAASTLLSGAALGVLAGAGALEGPALIGTTATAESLIMIAAGALAGMVVHLRPRGGPTQGSDAAAASTSSTGG